MYCLIARRTTSTLLTRSRFATLAISRPSVSEILIVSTFLAAAIDKDLLQS
jgi:hypothetical protein